MASRKGKLCLVESTEIERYLSRKFGFLPSDNQTAAILEYYALKISDSYEAFTYHATKARTAESNAAMEDQLRFLFEKHENILAANPSGHCYGNTISYPDVVLYTLYNQAKLSNNTSLFNQSECRQIMKLVASLDSNEKIAAGIATVA
ncbi:hypothetical protein AYI70_g10516 [Smittium culicis]|uniref:Glutathione S-transferase C-terminal domain-containing protein n=1 Tax=Smittium culicis TaxID=133412 RepID=A0A1R1X665_9FUNG|nr:hypothetical protein AYI70_g10516 [Smittium culicis]